MKMNCMIQLRQVIGLITCHILPEHQPVDNLFAQHQPSRKAQMGLGDDIGIAERRHTDLNPAEVEMPGFQLCNDISVCKYQFGIGGENILLQGILHGSLLQQPAESLIMGAWPTIVFWQIKDRDTVCSHAKITDKKAGISITLGAGTVNRELCTFGKPGQ